MRLFLLPISTKRSLIYCQRLNNQLSSETTYVDKLTTRASATWLKWEKAESGWQKKVTAYGNKLFERIPHEEWGLKSVPPLSRRREDEELKGGKEVQVQFPGSFISEEGVMEALKTMDASMNELDLEAKDALKGDPNSKPGVEPAMEAEKMLLTQSSGRIIADVVEIPELEEHVQRAVKQVEKALRGKKDLQEEKQELDNVNKEAEAEAEIKR
ncbi:MAG: hypothetical protein LQ352_003358 [Teloschistes flavicans]|nr:MAG: hypothetical protein LQ352_003358 [Teloschistes flavicans]